MARRNDFMEGFLRGLYQSGVGNPEVQRANEASVQNRNAQLTSQMGEQGMVPNQAPQGMQQKVGSFISSMFGGASTAPLLASSFKADPTRPQFSISPSGKTSLVPPGQPIPSDQFKFPGTTPEALSMVKSQGTSGSRLMKQFVNDKGETLMASPNDEGTFAVPPGYMEKSFATAQEWTKPKAEANKIRESQFVESQWNKLGKQVNALDKGSRSAIGMAAVGNQRAARALTILDDPNMDTVLKKYVESDLAGIMQGGSPHESMLKTQGYDNLVTQWANLKQHILAEPQALDIPEIRQQLKNTIQGIMAVDNDVLDTNVGIAKESYLKAIQSDPKRFDRMIGQVDKIKTIGVKSMGQSKTSNKPKTVIQNGHTYNLNPLTGNYE